MTQEFLNDYDDKVIALAQHLELNLEPDFDEDDTYYIANRNDYDTDEEFQQEQDSLNKEKEEAREEAIKEVTDELDCIVEGYDRNIFEYYGQEYYVLTDDEADEKWDEELDYYLEECVYPEIPEHLRGYFDDEAWKEDAKTDGRGHAISRYDDCEYEETVNDTTYFIYRIN